MSVVRGEFVAEVGPTGCGKSTTLRVITGREQDDTGLSYYRNRYYDPQTARFISEDPIGRASGQTNAYAYVGGNPVQLRSCNVRSIDHEGSLGLQIQNAATASVITRVPVELYAPDTDGFDVHVLLHVVDGICQEIEIYKDAPGPIRTLPEKWNWFVPSSGGPSP